MVRVIVFDFDLTLVDTLPYLRKGTMENLSRLKLEHPQISEKAMLGFTPEKYARMVEKHNHPCAVSWQEILKGHNDSVRRQVDLFEIKSIQTLRRLRETGKRLAIISNSPHQLIKSTVDKSDVDFELILSCDNEGDDHSKVNRLRGCLSFFECDGEELMYVGDHPNDITSAHSAGVIAVGITTGLHTRKELMSFNPEFIIDALDELETVPGLFG